MVSLKLVGLAAALLATGGLISLKPQAMSSASSFTESASRSQSSAAAAAMCAGFPAPVVARINQHFDPEKWVDVNVVERYDMKWFAVNNATGACTQISVEEPLKPGLNPISHAAGVIDEDDLLGQGLPVYVVAELELVPEDCGCRAFAAIRLRPSAAPPQPQPVREGPLPRVA